jgi:hypothetical protein
MSKRRLSLVLALLLAALAAVPVIAPAWRGDDDRGRRGGKLLIGFELRFTGPTTTAGTFHASGFVDDSGESTVSDLALEPFGNRDRARLSGVQTFTSDNGTIVTKFRGVAHDISQQHQYGLGRFRIVSGTGDYAGLKGRGRFTIVVDVAANRLIGTEKGRAR